MCALEIPPSEPNTIAIIQYYMDFDLSIIYCLCADAVWDFARYFILPVVIVCRVFWFWFVLPPFSFSLSLHILLLTQWILYFIAFRCFWLFILSMYCFCQFLPHITNVHLILQFWWCCLLACYLKLCSHISFVLLFIPFDYRIDIFVSVHFSSGNISSHMNNFNVLMVMCPAYHSRRQK